MSTEKAQEEPKAPPERQGSWADPGLGHRSFGPAALTADNLAAQQERMSRDGSPTASVLSFFSAGGTRHPGRPLNAPGVAPPPPTIIGQKPASPPLLSAASIAELAGPRMPGTGLSEAQVRDPGGSRLAGLPTWRLTPLCRPLLSSPRTTARPLASSSSAALRTPWRCCGLPSSSRCDQLCASFPARVAFDRRLCAAPVSQASLNSGDKSQLHPHEKVALRLKVGDAVALLPSTLDDITRRFEVRAQVDLWRTFWSLPPYVAPPLLSTPGCRRLLSRRRRFAAGRLGHGAGLRKEGRG